MPLKHFNWWIWCTFQCYITYDIAYIEFLSVGNGWLWEKPRFIYRFKWMWNDFYSVEMIIADSNVSQPIECHHFIIHMCAMWKPIVHTCSMHIASTELRAWLLLKAMLCTYLHFQPRKALVAKKLHSSANCVIVVNFR